MRAQCGGGGADPGRPRSPHQASCLVEVVLSTDLLRVVRSGQGVAALLPYIHYLSVLGISLHACLHGHGQEPRSSAQSPTLGRLAASLLLLSSSLSTTLPCPPSRFLPPNCFNASQSAVQPAAHAGVVCCIKLQNAAQSPDRVMLVLEGASKSHGNAGHGMQLVPRDLAPSGMRGEGRGLLLTPSLSLEHPASLEPPSWF